MLLQQAEAEVVVVVLEWLQWAARGLALESLDRSLEVEEVVGGHGGWCWGLCVIC